MPQIHLVPVNQGMTREELAQRLQSGWVLVGRQAANVAQGIIDPSKPMPPSGVVDVDVWVLSEPMLPWPTCCTRCTSLASSTAREAVHALGRPLEHLQVQLRVDDGMGVEVGHGVAAGCRVELVISPQA